MNSVKSTKEIDEISNLITDMISRGATKEEMSRSIRHSRIVVDAAKHKLDIEQSKKDNDIEALVKKYQNKP